MSIVSPKKHFLTTLYRIQTKNSKQLSYTIEKTEKFLITGVRVGIQGVPTIDLITSEGR